MTIELAKAKQILVGGANPENLQDYLDITLEASIGSKVDKDGTKVLSDENYTSAEKTKLSDLPTNATLTSSLSGKVNTDGAKVLSDNNFTTALKNKVDGLPEGSALTSALSGKVDTVAGKSLIADTPATDGKQYAIKDGVWAEVVAGGGDVEEAPIDGKQYARKDAAWSEVAGGGNYSVDVYVPFGDLEVLLFNEDEPTDFSPFEWMLNLREGMSNIISDPEEAEGESALYTPIIINKSSIEFVEEGDSMQFVTLKVSVLTSILGEAWESAFQVIRNITTGVDVWGARHYRQPLSGGGEFVPEAPNDGGVYGRSNEGWRDLGITSRVELTGGTGAEPLTFEQVGGLIHSWFDGRTIDWTNRETNFSFTGPLKRIGGGYNDQSELPINYLYSVNVGDDYRMYYSVEKEPITLPLAFGNTRGFSAMFIVRPESTENPVEVVHQYDDNFETPTIGTTAGDKKFYFYELLTLSDNDSSNGMGVYGSRRTFEVIVDSNGFIKESSPILKLYSNSLESNGDKAFTSETTLTKTGVGVYEISGVPLLSHNGWYIETPKDRNNNIYFTIDYEEVPEENKLIIRTYEPDYSSGKAENGNPVDILEGRFVSLRFEEVEEEVEEEQG